MPTTPRDCLARSLKQKAPKGAFLFESIMATAIIKAVPHRKGSLFRELVLQAADKLPGGRHLEYGDAIIG